MPETGNSNLNNNTSNQLNNSIQEEHGSEFEYAPVNGDLSSQQVTSQPPMVDVGSISSLLINDDESNPQTGTVREQRTPNEHATTTSVTSPPVKVQQQKQSNITNTKQSKLPPNVKDHRKIFVGGLPSDVTPEEFKQCFEKFGVVIDSKIMYDRITNRSRGFGFITFDDPTVCQRLIKTKRLPMRPDKIVEVKESQPRDTMNPSTTTTANYSHQTTRFFPAGMTFMANTHTNAPFGFNSDASMMVDSSLYQGLPNGVMSPNFISQTQSPTFVSYAPMQFQYLNDPSLPPLPFYSSTLQSYINASEAQMFSYAMSQHNGTSNAVQTNIYNSQTTVNMPMITHYAMDSSIPSLEYNDGEYCFPRNIQHFPSSPTSYSGDEPSSIRHSSIPPSTPTYYESNMMHPVNFSMNSTNDSNKNWESTIPNTYPSVPTSTLQNANTNGTTDTKHAIQNNASGAISTNGLDIDSDAKTCPPMQQKNTSKATDGPENEIIQKNEQKL